MGVGYNQTRHLNLFTKCEYKLRMLKSPTIKRKDVYTDANKSVWLKKNGKLMLALSPDTALESDQTMLVLGTTKDLQKCFHI